MSIFLKKASTFHIRLYVKGIIIDLTVCDEAPRELLYSICSVQGQRAALWR